jgi:hypothetical protein
MRTPGGCFPLLNAHVWRVFPLLTGVAMHCLSTLKVLNLYQLARGTGPDAQLDERTVIGFMFMLSTDSVFIVGSPSPFTPSWIKLRCF